MRVIRKAYLAGAFMGLFSFSSASAAVQTSLSYDYLGRVIQATHSGQTEDYYYSGEKRVFKKEASGKKRVYLYEDHSVVFDREVGFGKRGDADGNGLWTISDAVYLITYIFGGGPAPIPNILSGDADGTGLVTLSDVVKLINFIFAAGPAPSNETLSLPGAGYVEAPGAGRLWSDGAMGEEDLWYVEDPVSSTSAVLSGNQLVDVVHSTPFGEQLTQANLEKRYLFTGKELDATTGLFYYGARYYDPALGRFLQWDSVMDGPNRYLYVRNNPINANDPSGHEGGLRPPALNLNPQDYMNSINFGASMGAGNPRTYYDNGSIGAPPIFGAMDPIAAQVNGRSPDGNSLNSQIFTVAGDQAIGFVGDLLYAGLTLADERSEGWQKGVALAAILLPVSARTLTPGARRTLQVAEDLVKSSKGEIVTIGADVERLVNALPAEDLNNALIGTRSHFEVLQELHSKVMKAQAEVRSAQDVLPENHPLVIQRDNARNAYQQQEAAIRASFQSYLAQMAH